jgi:hypothetical protein
LWRAPEARKGEGWRRECPVNLAEIAWLFRHAVSKATALATAFPITIMLVTGLVGVIATLLFSPH